MPLPSLLPGGFPRRLECLELALSLRLGFLPANRHFGMGRQRQEPDVQRVLLIPDQEIKIT